LEKVFKKLGETEQISAIELGREYSGLGLVLAFFIKFRSLPRRFHQVWSRRLLSRRLQKIVTFKLLQPGKKS